MRPEVHEVPETPMAQAADWMSALRAGEVTGERAEAFDAWLNADPEHRAAFAELQAIWDDASEIEDDPTILALRELNRKSFNHQTRLRWAVGAVAATLLVAVSGGWALLNRPLALVPNAPGYDEQTLRTDAGQTTTAILRDGSTVVLDANTVVHAVETPERRLISLERGGAFFQVAKNPNRPFIVSAAGKTVTALGTAFEARVIGDKLDVTLIEGKVKVEQKKRLIWRGEHSTNLTAGYRLSAPEDQNWTIQRVDASKELSWMSGRLTFFNDTLEEAVAKVNRNSDHKIVLDPSLAKQPIVGVFASGDTDRFVRGMELAGIARVARRTDEVIELVPPEHAEK